MLPIATTVAGDRAEEHAGDLRRDRQTAARAADHGLSPVHDPLGDTAVFHDVRRENEERDRQQREFIHTVDQTLGNTHQRKVGKTDQREDCRQTEGDKDGSSQKQQHKKRNE